MRRAVAFVVVAVALGACVHLDGLTSDPTPPGPDGGDAATIDGSDGAVSTDAGPDGDASLCQNGLHDLCDDFERGVVGNPSIWDGEKHDHGAFTLTSDVSISPNHSARVDVEPTVAGANAEEVLVVLTKTVLAPKTLRCDFDFRVEGPGHTATVFSADIETTGKAVPGELFRLFVDSDSSFATFDNWDLSDGGSDFANYGLSSIPSHAWIHVHASLDFNAREIQITVGTTTFPTHPIQVIDATSVRLSFGAQTTINSGSTLPANRYVFDDIVCDATR